MRSFYSGILGMAEIRKPAALQARGGAWFRDAGVEVHVGIEEGFVAPVKAHPAFAVSDVAALAARVTASGGAVTWDDSIPGLARFHTRDPAGNRLEFQEDREASDAPAGHTSGRVTPVPAR